METRRGPLMETITNVESRVFEALSLTTPSSAYRVVCGTCKTTRVRFDTGQTARNPATVFCEHLWGIGRFTCRACHRHSVVVRPDSVRREYPSYVQEAHCAVRYVDDATGERTIDPSYQVWCPHCGKVLSTHLFGVAIFLCSDCRWKGVIVRDSWSLVMSCYTLIHPVSEWRWNGRYASWTASGGLLAVPVPSNGDSGRSYGSGRPVHPGGAENVDAT